MGGRGSNSSNINYVAWRVRISIVCDRTVLTIKSSVSSPFVFRFLLVLFLFLFLDFPFIFLVLFLVLVLLLALFLDFLFLFW